MLRRSLIFVLAVFSLTSLAIAQNSTPQGPGSSITRSEDSIRSIVVKFRTRSAMSDPNVLAALRSVSATQDVIRPLFHRPSEKNSSQGIQADPIGLDRIVQIPLQTGLAAKDAVRALSSVQALEYVEPNYRYQIQSGEHVPNDPLFEAEWWLQRANAPQAWEITEGDSTVHIGFVDTGVNWLIPDLKFQFAVNPAEDLNHNGLFDAWPSDSLGVDARGDTVYGDLDGKDHDGNGYANDVIGYDFVDQEWPNAGDWSGRDPIPQDEHGHGTYIAGILAAQQDNHIGISGIAPKCKLVALRAFDANGTGEDDDIASAIVYAADNHVQVLNLSFGDIIPSLLQRDAIRYAIANGVTVFASSGNDGSTGPNYPSDFDEVVSVGGTAPQGLYIYTTHGPELDLVAPGQDVYSSNRFGGYDSVNGTSASSPIAAGIAALLLSKNPTLTPIELRSILESTTHPVGDRSHSGNGEVDAYAALTYPGTAAIKLASPQTLDEFHMGDTIRLTGSAASTLFTGYTLSWTKDYRKDSLGFDAFGNRTLFYYDSVVTRTFDSSADQVLNGPLGQLDTHGLDTGTYTLRLAVASSDNRITDERRTILLAQRPPNFVRFSVDTIWVNTKRGLLLQATSDLPAQLEVRYGPPGMNPSFIADDKIGFEHAIVMTRDQAPTAVPLALDVTLRTPNGDSTTLHTTATLLNDAIREDGFVEKPYSLPAGFALDSVLSTPSGDDVIESDYTSGLLTTFALDPSKTFFRRTDSVLDGSTPQAIGNSMGGGHPELLVLSADSCGWHGGQLCGVTRIYTASAGHAVLGTIAFQNDTLFASTFARLDTTKGQAIVGVIDSEWMAYDVAGGRYGLLGTGVNPSPPDYYNANNNYSWPNVRAADLLGNGQQELITLDDDADLTIFIRDATAPGGFRAVFIDSNDAVSSGTLLTTGDFDGDGRTDIAFAYHPIFEQDTLDDYHPAYWTLTVLRNNGNFTFTPLTIDRFYGASQNDHFYLSSATGSIGRITNVTGRAVDDLAVSFFPNFYLIEYDSATQRMHPVWRFPISQSPRGALAWDFDKNGKREFGFFTGDSIHFFEHADRYVEQTPAPAGFEVTPRDTDRVDLSWAPVPTASEYYILRAAPGDQTFTTIDSTASTSYSDTTVTNGDVWLYSVAAYAPDFSIPASLAAFPDTARVHPMPHLSAAAMRAPRSVLVRTSQPPRTDRLHAGTIAIDDSDAADAIAMSSDRALVLELRAPLAAGTHRLRVTSFDLRDIYHSPFDTAHDLSFQVPPDTQQALFYIVRWTFEPGPGGLRIHVVFNEEPGTSALSVTHYTLTPYGTLVRVERDTADPNALFIDVQGVTLAALGVPFVLCVSNISSVTDVPLSGEGNCAGISLTEPDLSHVMVYPNPSKTSAGTLTFARLTEQADIRIYTMGMRFVRELSETGGLGGVPWDLRDDRGNIVPSGEYLYEVTGSNAAGQPVPGTAAKLVIVNDGTP